MWGPRRRKATGGTRAAAGGNPSFNAEEHHTHPSPGNASFSPGYTPSRTNFLVCQHLLRVTRCAGVSFPGVFCGVGKRSRRHPRDDEWTTSGRHQDQPIARWHVPRRPPRPACLVTELVLERQKPTSTAPSVMYVKLSLQNFRLTCKCSGARMMSGPARGEPLIHTDYAQEATSVRSSRAAPKGQTSARRYPKKGDGRERRPQVGF